MLLFTKLDQFISFNFINKLQSIKKKLLRFLLCVLASLLPVFLSYSLIAHNCLQVNL